MADLNNFNAHDVEPNAAFDPIPAGKYVVAIVATQMKPTRNGKGEYLEVEMEVIEGAHRGRKVWDRLTLRHPNDQTVEIARSALSAICRATDRMKPKDSAELHNIPLVASVAVRNRDDTGEPTNVVKGYAKRETAASVPVRGVPATNGSAPPWKR